MGLESFFKKANAPKKHRVTLQDHAEARERVRRKKPGMFYLGTDLETGTRINVAEVARELHTHIVGSSGSGKTSWMESMVSHDLERGRGLVYLDGKGDIRTLDVIYGFVKRLAREKDFRFFSLAHPELSNTYSPLTNGTATQVKDKLIGSILWSEPYYRKTSELAVQTLMRAVFDSGMRATFEDLDLLLTRKDSIHLLSKYVKDELVSRKLLQYQEDLDRNLRDLRGFSTDINLLINSEFGALLNTVNPEIDFIRAYQENQVVYIQLNKRGLGETAVRLGRMILKDLAYTSDYFDTQIRPPERKFFACYIDELDSFIYDHFISFVVQARSSGFALTLAHQSLSGDLDEGFRNKLIDNVNLNLFLRQRANKSVEACADVAGTRTVASESVQTEEKRELFSTQKSPTGLGNVFLKDEYRIDPNLIRNLQTGEAYAVASEPEFRHRVMLNYVPPLPPETPFQKIRVDTPERYERIPVLAGGTPDFRQARTSR